jgi:hypothetical protein
MKEKMIKNSHNVKEKMEKNETMKVPRMRRVTTREVGRRWRVSPVMENATTTIKFQSEHVSTYKYEEENEKIKTIHEINPTMKEMRRATTMEMGWRWRVSPMMKSYHNEDGD